MQFEHDKEIDALLRKVAKSDNRASAPDSHLDADQISMFAENALPDAGRIHAIGHFAECDRCRTILSGVISMNAADAPTEVLAPAPVEMAVETAPQISLISRLFGPKQLALGFGAIALLFAGFFGFTILSGLRSGSSELAKADQSAAGPARAEEASNVNIPDTMSSDQTDTGELSSQITNQADDSFRKDEAVLQPSPDSRSGKDLAVPVEKPKFDGFADSKSDLEPSRDIAAEAKENDAISAQREQAPRNRSDDKAKSPPNPAPPPVTAGERRSVLTPRGEVKPLKKEKPEAKKGNEQASTGAAATENRAAADETSVSATKNVGGKTFVLKNKAWYDSAYKNQATSAVRRGTDQYRSLDAGLRVFGDSLSGTVYVVWKSKAYKIQ